MNKKLAMFLCALFFTLTSANAHAWFFFFLPGSVTGAISDAVTGSEGAHCVSSGAKVGDPIRLPDGSMATIKSLSGTSTRCTQPERPIRALLESTKSPENVDAFKSKAGIELPDGWAPLNVSEQLKTRGYFFYATNRTIDAGLLMTATKREGITDMQVFIKSRVATQVASLEDVKQSEIEKIQINGMPAWRFNVEGKNPKSGKGFTYLVTVVEGGGEVVGVITYMYSVNFPEHKDELSRLAYGIKGLNTPPSSLIAATDKSIQPKATDASRLSNLKKLRDDGLITQKEFEAKKQEILKDL